MLPSCPRCHLMLESVIVRVESAAEIEGGMLKEGDVVSETYLCPDCGHELNLIVDCYGNIEGMGGVSL